MDAKPMSLSTRFAIAAVVMLLVGVAISALISAYAGALGASYMDSDPQRNMTSAAGTGTAGTPDDPAGIWSGPVVCEWEDNPVMTTAVEYIRGFEVPVTDAAFVPSRDPFDGIVTYLNLRDEQGWAVISETVSQTVSQNFSVDLAMSSDGRTGTATTVSGEMIFGWTCSGGP